MLTIIGTLIGFASSALPEFFKMWRDKKDREHELLIMDRQLEHTKHGNAMRLEEVAINADVSESQALYQHDAKLSGVRWVDGLRASVRPVITYVFFLMFAVVKISALCVMVNHEGINIVYALQEVWGVETQALFATVLTFWFGARRLEKERARQS